MVAMIVSPRQSRPADITRLQPRVVAALLALLFAFAVDGALAPRTPNDRGTAWAAPFGLPELPWMPEFDTGDADAGGDAVGRVPFACIGDESIVLWAATVPEAEDDGRDRSADALDTQAWTGSNSLILTDLLTGCSRIVDTGEVGRYAWLTVGPRGEIVGFQYQHISGGGSRNDPELRRSFTVNLADVFDAATLALPPDAAPPPRPAVSTDPDVRVALLDALAERLGDNAHRRNIITIGFREDGTYGEMWLRFAHDGQLLFASLGERRVFKPRKGKHQALYAFAADGTRNVPVFEVQGPLVDADVFAPLQHPMGDGMLCLVDYPGDRAQAMLHIATTPLEVADTWAPPVLVYAPKSAGVYRGDNTHDPLFTEWLSTVRGQGTLLAQVGLNNRLSVVAIDIDTGQAQELAAGTSELSYAHPALAPGGRCYACEVWTIEQVDGWDRAPVDAIAIEIRQAATAEVLLRIGNARFPQFVQDGAAVIAMVRVDDVAAYAAARDESADLVHLPWRPQLIETKLSPDDLGVLSAARRAELIALVAKLAHDDSAVRDRADFKLRNAGRAVLPLLTEHLATLPTDADAELRGRLEGIIAYLSKAPPPPPPSREDDEDG